MTEPEHDLPPPDLKPFLISLARLFEEGDEPIAERAAHALRLHAASPAEFIPHDLTTHREITDVLAAQNALPCAEQILPVMDDLSWHYSGYDDGRISENVALKMQTVEIIGSDGMIYDDTCRIGLFAQTAHTDYVIRSHPAEELFVQIAGECEWMKGDLPYTLRQPGARMFHASNQPHASRTKGSAMLAAWVWAGDLDYGKYHYTG